MRTSVMGSLALSLALPFAAGPAQAEWRQVTSGVNSTAYMDEGSLRKTGPIAAMRVLVDYPKPPFDGNNLPYRSLTMEGEYHCDDGRFRVLAITSHAANMGRGARPYTTDEAGEWEQITETSLQKDLWKQACSKSALPERKPVQSMPPADGAPPRPDAVPAAGR